MMQLHFIQAEIVGLLGGCRATAKVADAVVWWGEAER
jgi:hypothetical protein